MRIYICIYAERQTDRQTGRQTDAQTGLILRVKIFSPEMNEYKNRLRLKVLKGK